MDPILIIRACERLVVAASAPLLLYIGYKLFLAGASGEMSITARTEKWRGRIVNLAPGGLCFLLGAGLAVALLSSKVPIAIGSPGGDETNPAEKSYVWWLPGAGEMKSQIPLSVNLKYALAKRFLCAPDSEGVTAAALDTCDKELKASLVRLPSTVGLYEQILGWAVDRRRLALCAGEFHPNPYVDRAADLHLSAAGDVDSVGRAEPVVTYSWRDGVS